MTNFAHLKVSQPTHSQQTLLQLELILTNLIQRGCKMNWKHKLETKQLTTKQKTYLIMDSNRKLISLTYYQQQIISPHPNAY